MRTGEYEDMVGSTLPSPGDPVLEPGPAVSSSCYVCVTVSISSSPPDRELQHT